MVEGFRGVYSILLTPLDEGREVDPQSLRRLADHLFDAGANGVIILGEISETRKLTENERELIANTIFNHVRKRGPIIVGTTRQSTEAAVDSCLWAQEKGAAAVMVSPPTLSKPNDEAVLNHYKAIGEAIKIPIVVQDHPESSGVFMSPPLLARISKEVRGAGYLKLEDSPTPWKLSEVRELTENMMKIFGGENGAWLMWELKRGAEGIMTGFAYPDALVKICRAYYAGDEDKAWEIFSQYLPLFHYYTQKGVALGAGKEIYLMKGIFKTAMVKQPGVEFNDQAKEELRQLIKRIEKRKEVARHA